MISLAVAFRAKKKLLPVKNLTFLNFINRFSNLLIVFLLLINIFIVNAEIIAEESKF